MGKKKHSRENFTVENNKEPTFKDLSSKINPCYTNSKFIKLFSTAYSKENPFRLDDGTELITDPFRCCIFTDFITNSSYVKMLKAELSKMEFHDNQSDLYKFKQTHDLNQCGNEVITTFKRLLCKQFTPILEKITQIKLKENIDISGSSYSEKDYLLCHNDELEDRRIAFIYYLVPKWDEKDGGTLDLYSCKNHFLNADATRSVLPLFNSILFFEVTPFSFHSVSEVLSKKNRLSINGWFHGVPLPTRDPVLYKAPCKDSGAAFVAWINASYLTRSTIMDLREDFKGSGEIHMYHFFEKAQYKKCCGDLRDPNIVWNLQGPICKRKYYEASSNLPSIVQQFQELLTSEVFLIFLSNITDHSLHPKYDESLKISARCASNVEKWTPGSYYLLHDKTYSQDSYYEGTFYFNCNDWNLKVGGSTCYAQDRKTESLLQVPPIPNSFALVHVDKRVGRFVEYISRSAQQYNPPYFHSIRVKYCSSG